MFKFDAAHFCDCLSSTKKKTLPTHRSGLVAKALCCRARGRGFEFLATAAGFLIEAKSKNARVYEISAHVKDPQGVEIHLEPTTTLCLIACIASAR